MLLSIGSENIIAKFGHKLDGILNRLSLLKSVEEIEIGCDKSEDNYDIHQL
jgi:hypothetical protein